MRLTVTGAPQTLRQLITLSEYNDIVRTKEGVSVTYALFVVTGTVFMETNGRPATVANGYPIKEIFIDETTIQDISLIADWANADVRLISC